MHCTIDLRIARQNGQVRQSWQDSLWTRPRAGTLSEWLLISCRLSFLRLEMFCKPLGEKDIYWLTKVMPLAVHGPVLRYVAPLRPVSVQR